MCYRYQLEYGCLSAGFGWSHVRPELAVLTRRATVTRDHLIRDPKENTTAVGSSGVRAPQEEGQWVMRPRAGSQPSPKDSGKRGQSQRETPAPQAIIRALDFFFVINTFNCSEKF